GNPYVLEPNFADDPDGKTDWANPYYFTGRRADFLDGNNLTLQINRHRYYEYYTGRWLTQDPGGINPAGGGENPFSIWEQYADGANLYAFVSSQPLRLLDPAGLSGCNWCERLCCSWKTRRKVLLGRFCTLVWQMATSGDCLYQCEIFYEVDIECMFFGKSCDWRRDILLNIRLRIWPINQVDIWGMGVCPISTPGPPPPGGGGIGVAGCN
ncbi:MAG: RHS repeat-associated core domain-containing protein, partial [Planctomycetota bacterium]